MVAVDLAALMPELERGLGRFLDREVGALLHPCQALPFVHEAVQWGRPSIRHLIKNLRHIRNKPRQLALRALPREHAMRRKAPE